MAGRHPRDEHGRVLPQPGWPVGREAPGALELVRRFCNSVNRESGAERFTSPAAFDRWLVSEGLRPVDPSPGDLARILRVRELLHGLVVANAERRGDDGAWPRLAASLPLDGVRFRSGPTGLVVTGEPATTAGFLATIGTTIAAAVADGTWPRLKACRHCHWVVYDPSKNRSARWCSMQACGGRENARAYRARRTDARPS